MARARKYKHKGKIITRLSNGRHQIWIKDATGKPYRPSFPILDEAKRAIDEFLAREARGERFLAAATQTTFNEALDLKRKELIDKGRDKATIDRFDSICNAHLRPKFGHWKLSDFVDDRMETVKKWFEEKKNEGLQRSTLDHFKSDMNGAFDCAIDEGKMAPPNPVVAFKVSVPYVPKKKREPLPPHDIDRFLRAAYERDGREQILAFYARQGMAVVGLEMPLRTQDVCGLCWDCLNFDARIVFIRRVVKKVDRDGKTVWSLEETTKTDESGFGELHMSPLAHAWFSWWRDHLGELGLPTSGQIQVFRTQRVGLITPEQVQQNHMLKLVEKAKLIDERGAAKYTWYNLRHTVPSIWRAIGLEPDQIQDFMRHVDYATTKNNYLHRRPPYVERYLPLVEEVMDELGLPNTPEGRIDALSIGRVRLWRADGLDLPCSLPKSLAQRRLPSAAERKALPAAPVIDVVPTEVTTHTPAPVAITSAKKLKEWQVSEAKRLAAPPNNWARKRIAEHLGICDSTLSLWLGSPDADRWMRQTSRAARAQLDARCVALLDEGRGSNEIARELGVPHHWVTACARRYDRNLGCGGRRRRSHKMDRHEARIRELIAEGKSDAAIARDLGLSDSSVNAFIVRRRLRENAWGRIIKKEHECRILEGVAASQTSYAIAKDLGLRRSTVHSFIKRRLSQDPITAAQSDARESAASKPMPDSGKSRKTGGNSQLRRDHCTDSAQMDLFDAAD